MPLNRGHAALTRQKVDKFLYSCGPNKMTSVFILTNYPSVCRKSSCYTCNFVMHLIFLFFLFLQRSSILFIYITFCFSNMLAMLFPPTQNAWFGVKVQVHHICYVYNNLHCYVYNIFKYILMENTGKNSQCQKALFISGSSGTGGESRRGDGAVTPIAFHLIFSTTWCI